MTERARAVPWTAVAALTALGLLLRLFHMNGQSLWFDEIGSAAVATTPLDELVRGVAGGSGVAATAWLSGGYHGLLKLVLLLPHGSQDWLLRFVSVLIGTLTIPLFAWTVSAIAPAAVTVGAAALLAISPFHVWYSQEVRPYVLTLLLVVGAIGALARALESNRARWWSAVAVTTAAALYTHPVALGLPAIAGVVVLRAGRRVFWRGTAALAAAGLAYVPVVFVVRAHGANAAADLRPTGLFEILYAFYAYTVGFSLGPSTSELHLDPHALLAEYVPLIALVAVVFGGLALRGAWRLQTLTVMGRWLAAAWLVVPFAFTVAIALLTANPFNVRYTIVSFPAFVLLLALGLDGTRARVPVAALVVVLLATSLHHLYFDERYAKEDTRDLAALLRAEAGPDDLVLVNTAYMANAVRYYYPGPARVQGYPPTEGRRDPELEVGAVARDLDGLASGHPHVWLILSRTFHGDRSGIIREALQAGRRIEAEHRLAGIVAYRFAD